MLRTDLDCFGRDYLNLIYFRLNLVYVLGKLEVSTVQKFYRASLLPKMRPHHNLVVRLFSTFTTGFRLMFD